MLRCSLVFFVFHILTNCLLLVSGSEIYVALNSNYTVQNCGQNCGASIECACTSLQAALSLVPSNSTEPHTILVLPGHYIGDYNTNLHLSGQITIRSTNGSQETKISCPGDLSFACGNGTQTIEGFTLDGCQLEVEVG